MSEKAQLHYLRAATLLQQGRIADARGELIACLRDDPEFAQAYSLYAICMVDEPGQREKAILTAKKGISLSPQSAFAYYSLAVCLLKVDDYQGAKNAVSRAIQLEPTDADYRCLLGKIFMAENRFQDAKNAFLQALAEDADHHDSLAALSVVEARLGNVKQSEDIAKKAVQNSPEDADAHVARGVSLLYAGQVKPAFEAFREALRLDPNHAGARACLVQALQMNHFFYRWLFKFSTFIGQFSAKYQWGLIIGLYIVYRVVSKLAVANPQYAPVLYPLMGLYLVFCLFTWISNPLTYALLFFNRWGRLAMDWREKLTGTAFTACVVLGIGGLALAASSGDKVWEYSGCCILLTTIPITRAIETEESPDQLIYGVYSGVMVALFLLGLVTGGWAMSFSLILLMLIGFQFLAIHLGIKRSAPRF